MIYKSKNPSGYQLTVCMLFVCGIQLPNLLRPNFDQPILYISQIVISTACLLIAATAFIRTRLKPFSVKLSPGLIEVKGKQIQASDIRCIYLSLGDIDPLVGIRPKGTMLPPLNLCYRYVDRSQDPVSQLHNWCREHRVKLVKRRFARWL
ncbi:hypothetical protein Q5741_16770 [Paenibacillus sp. JX-17]|uniref:Uncharacterized protein n=1 Tax=Paenibacillus lacisoli TaxID=3064525 RepID=A0ABT9CJF6_9BACL|nr:hypothetical protein [Paenibacillus sp. JX-17]MDO7908067.1 hypothetical protein [Paenibacillus sp. JX-17]